MTSPRPLPPGWYPDPTGKPGERYFDGTNWTSKFVPDVIPGKSKIVAGLLQIFLGWFGAGRFYYGYPVIGAIQLLIGLLGLGCGLQPAQEHYTFTGVVGVVAILAASIWAVADGIVILAGAIPQGHQRLNPATLAASALGLAAVLGVILAGLIGSTAPTVNPYLSTTAPLTHGPQGHMTADPEPSACAGPPVTSVNTINAGFLRPDEHLMDIRAVVAGGATYIGANIAGDRPEMGNKVSSQDVWAVYMGQVYAITYDARTRTSFPDGRHVAGMESWPDATAALGSCVGALERARNGGR